MRDGTKLFTAIYLPNDLDPEKSYPILLFRTPYSIAPYGIDQYRGSLGLSAEFERSGYIFAFQDVRGKFMSEGDFLICAHTWTQNPTSNSMKAPTPTTRSIGWSEKFREQRSSRPMGDFLPRFYTSGGASIPIQLSTVSPQAPIADCSSMTSIEMAHSF